MTARSEFLTVSVDNLDLQMRMDAADRADAPLGPAHRMKFG
jgi:hypothetical protein